MMKAKEIKEWLATLHDDADVAIAEDAMRLVEVDRQMNYLEVGSIPWHLRDPDWNS